MADTEKLTLVLTLTASLETAISDRDWWANECEKDYKAIEALYQMKTPTLEQARTILSGQIRTRAIIMIAACATDADDGWECGCAVCEAAKMVLPECKL